MLQDRATVLILPGSFSGSFQRRLPMGNGSAAPREPPRRCRVSARGLAPGESAPSSAAGGMGGVGRKESARVWKNNNNKKSFEYQGVNLRASALVTLRRVAVEHHPGDTKGHATRARIVRGHAVCLELGVAVCRQDRRQEHSPIPLPPALPVSSSASPFPLVPGSYSGFTFNSEVPKPR